MLFGVLRKPNFGINSQSVTLQDLSLLRMLTFRGMNGRDLSLCGEVLLGHARHSADTTQPSLMTINVRFGRGEVTS
jgi:hypothetical protein